jgi:hypothetical protein
MATFRALREAAGPKPAEVVELRPEHFADTWPGKPTEAVRVGLRIVSEANLQTGRAEAARQAWERFPDEELDEEERVDAFNDALMAWVVAKATTQPDNAAVPWLEMAQDNLPIALSSGGLRELWYRVEALTVERSPLSPEATDDDLVKLVEALQSGAAWTSADGPAARRARRLLRRAMHELAL